MATINCHTCNAELLSYEPGQVVPSHVIVAPGAPVPGGNHVVHICPKQVPYVAQRRPSDVLDWTDDQERAAVAAALPNWQLRDGDVIFCMTWYAPGAGRSDVASAPLTVQVRRAGTDLKYAEQGVDFDEAAFTAAETVTLLEQLEIEPWDGLQTDLDVEARAAAAEQASRRWRAQVTAEASAVWAQALLDAKADAERAIEHAQQHPDDTDVHAAALNSLATVELVAESSARAETEAAEAAAAAQ